MKTTQYGFYENNIIKTNECDMTEEEIECFDRKCDNVTNKKYASVGEYRLALWYLVWKSNLETTWCVVALCSELKTFLLCYLWFFGFLRRFQISKVYSQLFQIMVIMLIVVV